MPGKNQKLLNRILSSVLAVISVISLLPVQVYSVDEEPVEETQTVIVPGETVEETPVVIAPEVVAEQDAAILTSDGESIDYLFLSPYDKQEVRVADATAEAAYQWQILHPGQEGLWVNIYDATEAVLPVTMALVGNMLSEDGAAQLRCRITQGEDQRYSSVLTVVIGEEEPVMALSTFALTRDATDATEETTPEFVTVTIEYLRYDYQLAENGKDMVLTDEPSTAFTSYVAALRYGTPLETTVPCPTIVGYDAYLVKDGQEVKCEKVEISLDSVTSNVVYTVKYKPAKVDYEVRYFFQNIYDDLYVENAKLVEQTLKDGDGNAVSYPVQAQGETGTNPDEDFTKAKFDGFTSLYYEPEKIAADGSTVFHVYYERDYCLMEFDCDGGYGTDTLYVRYGTYISVPNPVKSGYVFAGWDLVRTDGSETSLENGAKDELPETMPPYNTAYKALWTKAEASYSVAYWILDDEGNRTYLGSRTVTQSEDEKGPVVDNEGNPVPVKTGDSVSGYHDLDGTFPICGSEKHIHTDDCYTCGFTTEHTHTKDVCFKDMTLKDQHPGQAGVSAISALEDGGAAESGYIYVIYNNDSQSYWPKLYLDGQYYVVNEVGDGDPYLDDVTDFSSIVLGEALDEATGTFYNEAGKAETLTVTKYRPATKCGIIQHTHDNSCRPSCKEHTHDDSCYQDGKQLTTVNKVTFIRKTDGEIVAVYDGGEIPEGEKIAGYETDVGITVQGDDSTVVNVYYQYKKYTLKFYYAKTTGGTTDDNDGDANTYDSIRVVGGSTWNFGTATVTGPEDGPQLANVDNWGEVDAFPSLNDKGKSRGYQPGILTYGDYTYHYISFDARYGDDISDLWPCSVFDSVTRVRANTHGYWSGMEAFVSAWNGEHYVKYTQEHTNETIKGNYEKLDDNLLFNSEYTQEYTEVSYLCFWENGADVYWSVPELYRYNIWVEARPAELNDDNTHVDGLSTIERDGVVYKRINSYDTCDDSDVRNQTQGTLTGYEPVTFTTKPDADGYEIDTYEYKELKGTTDSTLLQQSGYYDSSLYAKGYDVNFYYNSLRPSLKFWNHNGWLGEGKGAGNNEEGGGVQYGTPLKVFGDFVNEDYMKAHYPDGLEPDAYKFVGWYTTALCLPGTEVKWDTMTMPETELVVYAKWVPVVHNVYFYYDYEKYAQAMASTEDDKSEFYWNYNSDGSDPVYPIPVEHNNLLDTAYNSNTPEAEPGYTFVGWFYIDQEGKKRFAPDTMEVKEDLHLFAEWKSGIDTQYTVNYTLENGTVIAAPTTGHLTAGKTKTFTAKVGTELLPEYQEQSLFPMSNSHSILMAEDSTQNTYTFLYKEDAKVYYRVRYLDKENNTKLAEEKIAFSTNAIITEKFKPVTGYYPTEYYIRKVLAYDGNATDAIEENTIIFYYTKDEKHGPFVVEYYTPVLGATVDDLYDTEGHPIITIQNSDGTESPNPYWYLQQSENGMADINATVDRPVEVDKFTGFKYQQATVTTYDETGKATVQKYVDENDQEVSGKVTQNGLEIRFFYARQSYDYVIKFVEYGTDKILGYGKLGTADILDDPVTNDKQLFESTIRYTAPDTIEKDGTKYIFFGTTEKPQEQKWTIRASNTTTGDGTTKETENVLTFYYQVKTVRIIYTTVCSVPDATDYGFLTLNYENASSTSTISGSVAYAANGFEFKGWYEDEAHTDRVDSDWEIKENDGTRLKVKTLPDMEVVTYYALFEPVQEDLVIKKTGLDSTNVDTFLFRVTGTDVLDNEIDLVVSIQGNGSVTIKDLYCGTYTVTELTNWSWTYNNTDGSQKTVTLTTQDKDEKGELCAAQITVYELIFTNTPKSVDWLHGESSAVENQFKINQVS